MRGSVRLVKSFVSRSSGALLTYRCHQMIDEVKVLINDFPTLATSGASRDLYPILEIFGMLSY